MKINKKCIITLLGIVIASPIAINSSISSASVFTRILQSIRSGFKPLTSRSSSYDFLKSNTQNSKKEPILKRVSPLATISESIQTKNTKSNKKVTFNDSVLLLQFKKDSKTRKIVNQKVEILNLQ
ncbi:hypothetical protein SFBM_0682 [Candidatus Arthromitus sp. SFB-mouse-Japan]|uniref:hypothetical protein n=1 Tax=Candidatus Arthromitus sp. SFB-mouse TaxID=49118 RepID=UPI00021B8099|nr:hypothetical protein [Candidatus Arthromitus sp. SFB-mouse]EIA22518.1 hypothetical protein SFB1_276G1 [Candidatus Arthromitus sp. SFB-1]EIA25326.1 hypothetical protein SFB2_017G1 [Candidatus Arthromitus sp. SFB-2]EIA26067.1 hypothetical protein SFB3_049G6 [Candidatus Arthromitus sp. SFB-3]EIA26379.1 hypothetical protein SFB4_259G12 [Candidatus Arthromitus sp. SFB-4]EIA26748.1 hypothetical protein SFB5_251G17 [Candidatus Arthromitus sp. SFB-5]EIA28600.1 hypothetical protein SFB6_038G12 [Can